MKQKIITGALLAAVLGPALYMGGPVFRVVVALFVAIGSREISSIFEPKWPKWMTLIILGIIIGFALTPTTYLFATVVATLFLVFLFVVLFDWFEIADGSLLFVLLMIVGLGVNGVLAVLDYGSLAILYVAVATYMTDTAAYFVGMRFGKRKLAPTVSPNKTIEGAVGGWVISSLVALIYASLLLSSKFEMNVLVITSLTMPMIGQLGDLALSSIKRYIGVKDFGTLFPEHGGVLDRIDSLLFNFMFFYVVLLLIA